PPVCCRSASSTPPCSPWPPLGSPSPPASRKVATTPRWSSQRFALVEKTPPVRRSAANTPRSSSCAHPTHNSIGRESASVTSCRVLDPSRCGILESKNLLCALSLYLGQHSVVPEDTPIRLSCELAAPSTNRSLHWPRSELK